MSLVILVISVILVASAIGFTSWGWTATPDDFESVGDSTTQFVFSIIYSAIFVLILILAAIAGIIGVVWFFLWISGSKPKAQRGLMSVFVVVLILLAIAYFINFGIGLAYFIIKIVQNDNVDTYHVGFFGVLAGFAFSVLFVLLALAAQDVCTERMDTSAY